MPPRREPLDGTKKGQEPKPPSGEAHSWAINNWPPDIYPNSADRARYVIRMHRDELLVCGALVRVGRCLVVLGGRYSRWLQKHASRVSHYPVAANRRRRTVEGEEVTGAST